MKGGEGRKSRERNGDVQNRNRSREEGQRKGRQSGKDGGEGKDTEKKR